MSVTYAATGAKEPAATNAINPAKSLDARHHTKRQNGITPHPSPSSAAKPISGRYKYFVVAITKNGTPAPDAQQTGSTNLTNY